MKKTRYSESQIVNILKEAEAGVTQMKGEVKGADEL
jgi:hypothetical protein